MFQPQVSDVYPRPQLTYVETPHLAKHLCGAGRPGHFRGVETVVLKLLNIVAPHRAYFGQKDAQQLAIIRHMLADLNVPVEVAAVPTVREPDGLALSSRNRRLTPEQRAAAPVLWRALQAAERELRAGQRDVAALRRVADSQFAAQPDARVEYFETVDPETLEPVLEVHDAVLLTGALWLGEVRLIDNLLWSRS